MLNKKQSFTKIQRAINYYNDNIDNIKLQIYYNLSSMLSDDSMNQYFYDNTGNYNIKYQNIVYELIKRFTNYNIEKIEKSSG